MTRSSTTLSLLCAVLALVFTTGCDNSARRHGNEAAAIGGLRTIMTAQAIHREKTKEGNYGTLKELGDGQLLDSVLASGTKQGYKFKVRVGDASGKQKTTVFAAWASPVAPGKTGDRYFYVDQTGILRYSTTGEANEKSTKIGQ